MKNTKIILATALAIVSIFFMSSFLIQKSTEKFLRVRTIEETNGVDSKIIIMYEDGKVKEIELEKFHAKNFTSNSKIIHSAINDIASKGYSLVSFSGGNGDIYIINTYLFVKK